MAFTFTHKGPRIRMQITAKVCRPIRHLGICRDDLGNRRMNERYKHIVNI